MILVVGQEKQNEPRGAFCRSSNYFFIGLVFYWFGFLSHELPSALVPCVQGHLRCCTEQGIKVVLQS